MSEAATDLIQPPKRARVDHQIITPATIKMEYIEQYARTTPTEAVRDYVLKTFELLPTRVFDRVSSTCHEFYKLLCLIEQQTKTINKLEEEDYVPRSIKLGFELRASDRILDHTATKTEFEKLQADTVEIITTFQTAMKEKITKSAKLEGIATEERMKKIFCTDLLEIAYITLISFGKPATDISAMQLVFYTTYKKFDRLTMYIPIDDIDEFRGTFKFTTLIADT